VRNGEVLPRVKKDMNDLHRINEGRLIGLV
jgi:hypothetical protein